MELKSTLENQFCKATDEKQPRNNLKVLPWILCFALGILSETHAQVALFDWKEDPQGKSYLLNYSESWGKGLSDEQANQIIASIAAKKLTEAQVYQQWQYFMSRHGNLDALYEILEDLEKKTQKASFLNRSGRRLKANLLYRQGKLKEAKGIFQQLVSLKRELQDLLSLGKVLDALGNQKECITLIEELLAGQEISTEERNQLQLRLGLLKIEDPKQKESGVTDFVAFAQSQESGSARNELALALALVGEVEHAVELFDLSPEALQLGQKDSKGQSKRKFQSSIRLAEWASEAKDWQQAQAFAWIALEAAAVKRDRSYALALLVESYRQAKALPQLIDMFGEKRANLSEEAKQTWIDLLREQGQVDKALALFQGSGSSISSAGLSKAMCRELLDMHRQKGDDEALTAAYRKLIEQDPNSLEWREGLCTHYLLRSDRKSAEAIWQAYRVEDKPAASRLSAAAAIASLGLSDLAREIAASCAKEDLALAPSLLFVFELELQDGRLDEAKAVLERLNDQLDSKSAARKGVADAFARLGDKKRASEVLESLCKALGENGQNDTRMKLAVILSEIGEDEKALGYWHELWQKVTSVSRRKYVEDRLLTTAARLGKLAKIAIKLEKSLALGEANEREAGMLVSLYSHVKDAVSAAEIIEEFMQGQGREQVEVLQEKARIYLDCEDFYNYEECLNQLIEADPEGRPDYMRQQAMSLLEQGQQAKARDILAKLKETDSNSTSLEFEAGVLNMVGLKEEALLAYSRSVATHSQHIDTYLLLSNILVELGHADQAAGMFQYLAAHAKKDDLYIIAIDGLLNLRDGRANRGAPNRVIEWARRLTLERLSKRGNKLYLYRLLADLSEELEDKSTAMRSLQAAIPIAGEKRTPLLRELMTMASPDRPRTAFSFNTGPPKNPIAYQAQLLFGRRLLGQGEFVPPQVYLELGQTFLKVRDVRNALRTFQQASRLPEFNELQQKIAKSFEEQGYPKEALEIYERMLVTQSSNVGLILKVAQLREQLGNYELAWELYGRGLEIVVARKPFRKSSKKKSKEAPQAYRGWGGANLDSDEADSKELLAGLLSCMPSADASSLVMSQLQASIQTDLDRIMADSEADSEIAIKDFPKLLSNSTLLRSICTNQGDFSAADNADRKILKVFAKDKGFVESMLGYRLQWGYVLSAREFVKQAVGQNDEFTPLLLKVGLSLETQDSGLLPIPQLAPLMFPLLSNGENERAKQLLQRCDFSTANKDDLPHMSVLASTAALLEEKDLALSVCRHWLNLMLSHSNKNLYSAFGSFFGKIRAVLDSEQQLSLLQQLIEQVSLKPEKYRSFIQALPRLQKEVGGSFLSDEQVQALLESRLKSSDGHVYGVAELLSLASLGKRAEIFQNVWHLVPATSSFDFMLQSFPHFDENLSADFSDFLVDNFESALAEAQNKNFGFYLIQSAIEASNGKKLEALARMIELFGESQKESASYAMLRVSCFLRSGDKEQGLKILHEQLKDLVLNSNAKDYWLRSTTASVLKLLTEEDRKAFVIELDKLEQSEGVLEAISKMRLDVYREKSRSAEYLVLLEREFNKHSAKGNPFLGEYTRLLNSAGYRLKTIEILEAAYEADPADEKLRDRLISSWRSLGHPVSAAGYLKETGASETQTQSNDSYTAPHKKADLNMLKDFVDKGDWQGARNCYRQIWRKFPRKERPAYYYVDRSGSSNRRLWPLEAKKNSKPYMGGLPSFEEKKVESDRETVQSILVKNPVGAQEIALELSSMGVWALSGELSRDSIRALVKEEVSQSSWRAVFDRLLAKDKEAKAGRLDYAMLFALLEDLPESEESSLASVLDTFLTKVDVKDVIQLRRLARLYAKSGDSSKAASIYGWCAANSRGSSGMGPFGGRSMGGALGLNFIEEIIENLEGERRDEVLAMVFAFLHPGEDSYGIDAHEQLVLESWLSCLKPAQAIEKTRAILDKISNQKFVSAPSRTAARTASLMFAQVGDYKKALSCLEVVVCKLEAPTVLEYSWLRSQFERVGYLSNEHMLLLFPAEFDLNWDTDSGNAGLGWLQAAAQASQEWVEQERMDPELAFRMQCLLALRLEQHGSKDKALELLTQIQAQKPNRATMQLWLVDLSRKLGEESYARELETKLFAESRLRGTRVKHHIEMLASEVGKEEALEAGMRALKFTLDDSLLAYLQELSKELNKDETLQELVQLVEDKKKAKKLLKSSRS